MLNHHRCMIFAALGVGGCYGLFDLNSVSTPGSPVLSARVYWSGSSTSGESRKVSIPGAAWTAHPQQRIPQQSLWRRTWSLLRGPPEKAPQRIPPTIPPPKESHTASLTILQSVRAPSPQKSCRLSQVATLRETCGISQSISGAQPLENPTENAGFFLARRIFWAVGFWVGMFEVKIVMFLMSTRTLQRQALL